MTEFSLSEGLFLYPTPKGCFHAISADSSELSRDFINKLLKQTITPPLTEQSLKTLTAQDQSDKALELLHHCQKLGWVQGLTAEKKLPEIALENLLPDLLRHLSGNERALLVDDQGFNLSGIGFTHEAAEEMSALAAEIAVFYNRRKGLLNRNLGIKSQAWAIVDSYGNSEIGFWPMFIGNYRFVIVIEGVPFFNTPEFVELVWLLSIRYADTKSDNS